MIELFAEEFIHAIQSGTAKDISGTTHNFLTGGALKDLIIRDVIVRGIVTVDGITIENQIFITDCEFKENLYISHCTFNRGFIFNNNNCIDGLHIEKCSFIGFVDLTENFINDELWLLDSTVNSSAFHIRENTAKKIWISKCELYVQLWLDNNTAKTNIDECTIQSVTIWDVQEKLFLNISDCKIEKIMLDGLINYGYMQWNNLRLNKSLIQLEKCVMGKWDIINCDLSQASLTIYSTKITDAFYTNTKFPETLYVPSEFQQNQSEHEIKRDGYNQLKTLAQKQNDRRMFLHYQAEELKSYKATLQLGKD